MKDCHMFDVIEKTVLRSIDQEMRIVANLRQKKKILEKFQILKLLIMLKGLYLEQR